MNAIVRPLMSISKYVLSSLAGLLPNTVRGPLAFEVRSFFGRLTARRLRLDRRQPNYMNLGSANDRSEGYVSIDFFSSGASYCADLRFPLLVDDEVFDGIFTEHTLEHLNYGEVTNVLAECERVLKPGCLIRVIVPDLSLFVKNYASGNEDWFREWERQVLAPRGRSMMSKMEALSVETQEFGHRSAWDFETMSLFLTRAGFSDVRQCSFRDGGDPRLLQDKDEIDRTMVSLYVEGRKRRLEVSETRAARDG